MVLDNSKFKEKEKIMDFNVVDSVEEINTFNMNQRKLFPEKIPKRPIGVKETT